MLSSCDTEIRLFDWICSLGMYYFVDVLSFLFSSTIQIQSWIRMSLARKKYLERSKYFKDHVSIYYLNLFAGVEGGGGTF